jgi:hypothetical protein
VRTDTQNEELYLKRATFIIYLCIQTALVAAFIVADHVKLEYAVENLKGFEMASSADRVDLREKLNNTRELTYRLENIDRAIKDVSVSLNEHLKESKNAK